MDMNENEKTEGVSDAKSAYAQAKERISGKIASDPIMIRNSYKFDLSLVRRSDPDDKLIGISANSVEKEIPLLKVLLVTAAAAAGIFAVGKLYELGFNVKYKKRFGGAKTCKPKNKETYKA